LAAHWVRVFGGHVDGDVPIVWQIMHLLHSIL
jgi:hypothetical protein